MCAMRNALRKNGRASPDGLWGFHSEGSNPPSQNERWEALLHSTAAAATLARAIAIRFSVGGQLHRRTNFCGLLFVRVLSFSY